MGCSNWTELDGARGNLLEYCKGKGKRCSCGSERNRCNFPDKYVGEPYMQCELCGNSVDKLYPTRFGDEFDDPAGFILHVCATCVPEDEREG